MKINSSNIGRGYPTYIIAELSCNHNQNYDLAIKLIHAAKEAGANAIKIQTYTPDSITLDCDSEDFQIKSGTLWDNTTLYKLYQEAYTPWDWIKPLMEEATKLGMDFFSSAFDESSVDFLETLNIPAYKIASFEVNDHILLKKVARTGKPIILSTGATELPDIAEAVDILRNNGTKEICILKCTSAYPAPVEDANLKTIKNISKTFGVISGLSDHTLGIEVPIAAVCLGASVIEKHFTLSRNTGSADDAFSLEPIEFKQMVESIRKVEKAIGQVIYKKSSLEKKSFQFRRSLYIVKEMNVGDVFTKENVRSIRPGYGLHTKFYDDILGRKARCNINYGTALSWDLIL